MAAFRIWNVIEYYSPYFDLAGEDWDGVLREFIPKMERAANATEYHLTVAEMVARLHDSHGFLFSTVLRDYFGVATGPVVLRFVEGVPVVTRLLDEGAAKAAGVEVGDVVVSIDGERVEDRIARWSKYISASTPQWLSVRLAQRLLSGPEGSTATVVVRDGAGHEREVKLPRHASYYGAYESERTGDVVRLLPGNIGYADLDRLPPSGVDEMFEKFKNTRAIIFDMRGYPKGTAWVIAPRLTERTGVVGAVFYRRNPIYPEGANGDLLDQDLTFTFSQALPTTTKWRYTGKTVMLIDERALSQAEHTGLFFEAANGTKFVGSPTGGANGDVTNFFVPGGIRISFSGQGVRHADGRQLQRKGLAPDVDVRPTIAGIRAGRDEVLDKAIEYLEHELGPGK
jgi:C-terminal processing protease CtpA/Prc